MCRDSLETNTLNTRFTQYTPLSNKKEDQQTERQKTSPIISKHIHDPSSEKTKQNTDRKDDSCTRNVSHLHGGISKDQLGTKVQQSIHHVLES